MYICSVSIIFYSDRVFASLCPCHDHSLEVFTRDKNRLFTLFPLLLAFFEINQGAVCKFLNWSPPISCLRKCKVKACCSVAQSCPTLQPYGLQHTRLPCPSLSPGACSNSYPLSWWSHPTILSSVIPFSSYLQSFPASGSFLMSQFFASGGQSIGTYSASVLQMNIQDWFLLGLTGLISLQSKGLSRVFSNTTVQKH